jgi:rRNA maturation endonuclease Nob1
MRLKCDQCYKEFEEEDLIDKEVLYFCIICEGEMKRKVMEAFKDEI